MHGVCYAYQSWILRVYVKWEIHRQKLCLHSVLNETCFGVQLRIFIVRDFNYVSDTCFTYAHYFDIEYDFWLCFFIFLIFILFKATVVHYTRIQLMVEHSSAKPDTEAILLTSEEQRTKLKNSNRKAQVFKGNVTSLHSFLLAQKIPFINKILYIFYSILT